MEQENDPLDGSFQKMNNSHGSAEHAEEGEGPWIMSFADMVTLLMCFFILFFQTEEGNIRLENPESVLEKLQELQKIIGLEVDKNVHVVPHSAAKSAAGSFGTLENFKEEMTQASKQLDLLFSIGVTQPGEIELTFLNHRFFRSGRTILTPKAKSMLMAVAAKLNQLEGTSRIAVEGHTDSDPIKSSRFPSNWELSAARASSVVRLLIERGVDPSLLVPMGRANFDPIIPEEGKSRAELNDIKALNRRIKIIIRNSVFENSPKAPTKGEVSP